MNTWIALLRGINVGGKNILPMQQLRSTLEDCGLNNVQTYIQSGNVAFQSGKRSAQTLTRDILAAIHEHHELEIQAIVLSDDQLAEAIAANPFPKAVADPKTLHLNFLAKIPSPKSIATLRSLASPTEKIELVGNVLYVLAPDGIGRSKLANKLEKVLAVTGTGRNWRTVCKLAEMAEIPL